MRLRLGTVEHDLTTRSLVMASLDGALALEAGAGHGGLVARADGLAGEGADLIDLGGVDTDPGRLIGEDEELERVVPVIQSLRASLEVPLAVATRRPSVLAAAAAAGAVVIRDGSSAADPAVLTAAQDAGVTVVIRHRGGQGTGSGQGGLVGDVRAFLAERLVRARAAGIPNERMIVDAGLDVGKTPQQSLLLLRESAALADLGPPLLLDAANKRFLGLLLDLDVGERRMASQAAAALGIARGCRVVRAHDVRGARRVADVLAALLGARLAHVTARGAEAGRG